MDEAVIAVFENEIIKAVRIQSTLVSKLNLADFQNAVPLIRELRVINETTTKYSDVTLTLSSSPQAFKPRVWRIDTLMPGAFMPIPGHDLILDGALLSRLTEAENATISYTLTVVDPSVENGILELARHESVLELLPRNHWGGLSHLPDMSAAFVQPNDPAVERLLKQAADLLRQSDRSSALDGYSGGAKRAWELASAIWAAVARMKLHYALPPSSFEQTGQKIRSPSHIGESGLATCMDLALLFAAALEQAGLHPVLVFTEGHAFAGLWLKPEEFSTTVVDDITALRKRLKLKELVLFETTFVTQQPVPSFTYATERGALLVAEDQDHKFQMLLDVRRARLQRIKPLASAESHLPKLPDESNEDTESALGVEEAPSLPDERAVIDHDLVALDPKDRLGRWQRKLLDLSLRNNLLNFKPGKKSLRLEAPDPGALEDILAGGQTIKLLTRPDLMDGADPRDQALYEAREREDVRKLHAMDALKRREVFVGLSGTEMDARLTELYRGARTTLQEGGSNTLYLALGFLCWERGDRAGVKYRAPLILIPVSLERKSARSGFSIVLHDEEPRFNPTLVEMLRQDFELSLGILEGELPRDDSGLDIDAIWKTVAQAIKDIPGWEVNEDVVLSMFSFAKYLMWRDLAENADKLRESPVVRHLLDTPREAFPSDIAFPEDRRLDAEFNPREVFCPLPADSSQLSAVMAASKGKDFVLIGPPGTGKSQTIANLIAQSIAQGKRVLFVSEKIAALDVVYRRLREIGLGEFCLEVHSSKARKTDVLTQLQSAWEAKGVADSATWHAEADRLQLLRDGLNTYVERLHRRYPNGYSIFDAIGLVCSGIEIAVATVSWTSPHVHSRENLVVFRELADRLEVNAQAIGYSALMSHPLEIVGQGEWSPSWQQSLIQSAREVLPAAQSGIRAAEKFVQSSGLPLGTLSPKSRHGLVALSKALPLAGGHDWRFALRPDARSISQRLREGLALVEQHRGINQRLSPMWPTSVLNAVENGLSLLAQRAQMMSELSTPWSIENIEIVRHATELLANIATLQSQLSAQYGEAIELLDVTALLEDWTQAEQSFWPKSWFGTKGVTSTVVTALTDGRAPDVAKDLRLWIEIRALRTAINKLTPTNAQPVWAGADSQIDQLEGAIGLQLALTSLMAYGVWTDSYFEAIDAGLCGEGMKSDLTLMRNIFQVDLELQQLTGLKQKTDDLWQSLSSNVEFLKAAVAYQKDRKTVADQGTLEFDHDLVGQGHCGMSMQSELRLLHERAALEEALTESDDLRELTAGLWSGLKTKVDVTIASISFQAQLSSAIAQLAETPEQISAYKGPLQQLLGDANALLEPEGLIVQTGVQLRSAFELVNQRIGSLATAGKFTDAGQADLNELTLTTLIERCEAVVCSEHGLRAWCAWRKVSDEASATGLHSVVEAMQLGHIQTGGVRKTFETNYARWWLNAVVDNEPVIRGFVSVEHEQRIRDFRALDDRFTDLTRNWLRARLCADLPSPDSISKSSEWGVLRHEMSKKTRHLPLRELMARIPEAMTKLTPCLLMSPLSIAQYLAPGASVFDLVIFDEASQIPVWDAVGAMARGRQVVMVGDPKQLPPTSFFDRAESTADDEDVESDLESILDECISANLPIRHLNWHYRSRHESLIAFSNQRYYESKLVTFPSPVTNDRAVKLKPVAGVYEKGGSRTNPIEAQALVADLVSRLRSSGFRESKMTMGVVTFNGEQQKLIEDLLDDARRKDPSLESYFAESEIEPVFVKNLESVQGDERDIIYFSITYGPDAAGVVSMNFGPLNRQGGERRLNVAVTRARHELCVFASLKPEQMDLARTQANGVRDLKHFLEFAERGARALVEATPGSVGGFDSPFEEAVSAALVKKGWQVHTQVGVSAFRIDLGVVDPDAPGRYLSGVECDGATYHRSATARDRDKLREFVLRGLGWEILRIWSTDWWIDAQGTTERIHGRLNDLLAESRAKRAAEEAVLEATRLVEDAAMAQVIAIAEAAAIAGSVDPVNSANDADGSLVEPEKVYAGLAVSKQSPMLNASILLATPEPLRYRESVASAHIENVTPEAFFDEVYSKTLFAMISHVVSEEGPILDSMLARRIARAHGWVRTGAKIRERVASIARQAHRHTVEDIGDFYWPTHIIDDSSVLFRRPGDEDSIRATDEISLAELGALALELTAKGKQGDALLLAMSREMGLHKLTASSRARLEKAVIFQRSSDVADSE
jgi:very-short-patch-repair endonuclease